VAALNAPGMSRVAVIGGGPAGLMAAERLAQAGIAVTVYDRMASVARKFLLAGRGGLNLTHSEPLEDFLARYSPPEGLLRDAIEAFPPQQLRAWCEALGQPTFVGTSGRIFPQAMKASPLLRAWLRRLESAGVTFAMRHRFIGWRDGALCFARPDGMTVSDRPDATVLALGGASWPRLGSDGGWVATLAEAGVTVTPLRPANCGFLVPWSEPFRSRRAGAPLKRIAVTFAGRTLRGEAVIVADGLEGDAIYALSEPLREAVTCEGSALLTIDLRPDVSHADLAAQIARGRKKDSLSTTLRKIGKLSAAAIDLMREAAVHDRLHLGDMPPTELAALIKAVPLRLTGIAGIARAISTAGGVSFDEIDRNFMLRKLPGVFVAGEMLDWEAPTGGYLLQASFATGIAAADGAIAWCNGMIEQAARTRV
jgi:uncharacterized flavoprotein (TIGR03862 family)